MSDIYDAIIIGAGPAGLTAGLYLARAGKKTMCIEKGAVGGQMLMAHMENYPGFPEGIPGRDLAARFEAQAVKFGMELMPGTVDGLTLDGDIKEVLVSGFPLKSKIVIIATGIIQKLGIPGEEEYLGRGVSYCATCDGALYRGATVAVIGSTDWAVEEALYLSKFATRLIIVTRQSGIKPKDPHREELLKFKGLEIEGHAEPIEVTGDGRTVKALKITRKGLESELALDGVFICSGKRMPGTSFLGGLAELTPDGYIVTGPNMETATPGLYAAGDVRRERFHQVSTAVGDATVAAMDAMRYLK